MEEKTVVQIVLTDVPAADGEPIVKASIRLKGTRIIMAVLHIIYTLCKDNEIEIEDFIEEIKNYEEFMKNSPLRGVYIQ